MHPSLENLKCPECKGPMVPRTNRREGTKFWGCANYPKCNGTRDSEGLSKEEKRSKYEGEEPEEGKGYSFERGKSRRYD